MSHSGRRTRRDGGSREENNRIVQDWLERVSYLLCEKARTSLCRRARSAICEWFVGWNSRLGRTITNWSLGISAGPPDLSPQP